MGDELTSLAPVLPVSLLVSSARLLIERHLGLAWISGELSNFTRAASGHCYFLLKDELAQVRCVFFRHKAQLLDFALKDGLRVELRAVPTIYEARGEFQLNVETARLAGLGALYEKFARLKARLEAAGWFRAERKQAVAPDRRLLLAQVKGIGERWRRAVERGLELRMQRLDSVSRRLTHPAARIDEQQATIAKLAMRLCRAAGARQLQTQRDLDALQE